MVPQDTFMVAAAILPGREQALRDLLASMNRRPGEADPANPLVRFAEFRTLHYARFVILADNTLADLSAYGEAFADAPVHLVFLGDCDGPADRLLAALAQRAEDGLRRIFAHCRGYGPDMDLRRWMLRHSVRPSASYVNVVGRTVGQILDEAALHKALVGYLAEVTPDEPPARIRMVLQQAARDRGPMLCPPRPTPVLFWLRQTIGAFLAGLLLLAATVLLFLTPLILFVPVYLYKLRQIEKADPVITPRPDDEHVRALAAIEDYDLVNSFSAFGSVKPGWFRKLTLIGLLFALNFGVRLLYARGRLARIGTIHFARWVFLDNRRRLFFASNYDRSLETYADDFINKVAFGINLVFSNGIGYPSTRFLILDGAKNERNYRHYLRRHQVPTQVWYNAYPGLTVFDIGRNARIRAGLERATMTDAETRQWLALI